MVQGKGLGEEAPDEAREMRRDQCSTRSEPFIRSFGLAQSTCLRSPVITMRRRAWAKLPSELKTDQRHGDG